MELNASWMVDEPTVLNDQKEIQDMTDLSHAKIDIMATHGFEQSELMAPLNELEKAGAQVDVATLDGNPIKGWIEQDWGDTVNGDLKIEDIVVDDYICLVLPGGQMNPDVLRADKTTLQKVL
jgi:protease I